MGKKPCYNYSLEVLFLVLSIQQHHNLVEKKMSTQKKTINGLIFIKVNKYDFFLNFSQVFFF
jgi:hypothetical protein